MSGRLVRRLRPGRARYSSLDEEAIVRRWLDRLGVREGHAVDIAACDGVTKSNTLALYEAGWRGLAVEGDPESFSRLARAYRRLPGVALARTWVTPGNVSDLLDAHGIPPDFAFLNLDIDGYDHFVLAALLERHRPRVICAEINEKIPPPVRFTVLYDPGYRWAEDHFYGQSIVTLHALAAEHGYALVELHYNSAFLVPAQAGLPGLTPADAYRSGYLERPDRHALFPWNEDMEALHALDDEAKVAFLNERFAAYAGRYAIGL